MRLRYVEVVGAVMRCGTVKGAAQVLHITQPAASRLLQQAEQNLGFALFRRERGRLVPTQEALSLRAEFGALDEQLDRVRRHAENLRRGPAGEVRVLCAPSLADHWLTTALVALRARFPTARASLRTAYSRDIAERLALRDADVGFTFSQAGHPAVQSEVLATGRVVCVGPLAGRTARLADVLRRPVIELDAADPIGQTLHLARDAEGIEPQATCLAHNYHTAIAMARAGLGIAVVDSFSAAAARLGDDPHAACRCLPLEPQVPVAVHVQRPVGVATSALVEHLVSTMRDRLQAHASGATA